MKGFKLAVIGLLIMFITGCQFMQENMVLLDEEVSEVNIAVSNGAGEMNMDILYSFTDDESIHIFEQAIRNARRKDSGVDILQPDYDVMVEYEEGFPTHAIHLWLGEENEESTLMYFVDAYEGTVEIYVTSPKVTSELRELLISKNNE